MPVKIPVFVSAPFEDKPGNLSLVVSATDSAGRSPSDPTFAGVSREGQCRVYLHKIIPVTAAELYDGAFIHLDAFVQASGGVEELLANPERIPVANIWGDVGAPWRCIAGSIYSVQMAGYPTVGFISRSIETDTAGPTTGSADSSAVPSISISFAETHAIYVDLPIPNPPVASRHPVGDTIAITTQNQILWNGQRITPVELTSKLERFSRVATNPELQIEPEAGVSYDFVAKVLDMINVSHVSELRFAGNERYCSLGTENDALPPDCPGNQD